MAGFRSCILLAIDLAKWPAVLRLLECHEVAPIYEAGRRDWAETPLDWPQPCAAAHEASSVCPSCPAGLPRVSRWPDESKAKRDIVEGVGSRR